MNATTSYAVDVARLLWPPPWDEPTVARTRPGDLKGVRDAYVFPSPGRARLLIPTDLPDSSVMIRRLGGDTALAAPARRVLERCVRSRAFPLLRWPVLRVQGTDPDADSMERHLGEHLGTDVRVGILLGTRRVNQKPVLQIFDLGGTVLGYAKVGHNQLTAALVRREADALAAVAAHSPTAFAIPEVLHHGQWAGLEVLVTSPLRTTSAPVTHSTRLAATRELTRLAGTSETTVAASPHTARLRKHATELARSSQVDRFARALEALVNTDGDKTIQLGGWHGDWGQWNMGMDGAVLQVWDWERYDQEVPFGFDALHFAAQFVRPGEKLAQSQESDFLNSVPPLLNEQGVDRSRHGLTLRLYLCEIAARYLAALEHGATPALRRRTDWVLMLLERELRQSDQHEGRP